MYTYALVHVMCTRVYVYIYVYVHVYVCALFVHIHITSMYSVSIFRVRIRLILVTASQLGLSFETSFLDVAPLPHVRSKLYVLVGGMKA